MVPDLPSNPTFFDPNVESNDLKDDLFLRTYSIFALFSHFIIFLSRF